MLKQTLAIIKPNAVKNKRTGDIISQIEKAKFLIKKLTLIQMSLDQAKTFYKVHADRPFYNELCTYMCSGPVIIMVLEKNHAIEAFRNLIGATDPSLAKPETLRHQFGTSIEHNAIHGSDGANTAKQEIDFFFA